MQLRRIGRFQWCGLAVLLTMASGCASLVRTDDLEGLRIGSPLKRLSSKRFAFKQFSDARRTDNPSYVGSCRSHLSLDQPAASVVQAAIRKELERNGHKIAEDSSPSRADFVIEGTVYKYGLTQVTGWRHEATSTVASRIVITSVADPNKVFDKKYEGTFATTYDFPPLARGCADLFNQGLLAMVKDMSTDEELMTFLEK